VSALQASLQKVYIECLESILRPIIRLTLHCGLGFKEFEAASRRVFIDVASEEYGVRGRPANAARISAKTGLPRKVVRRHRVSSDVGSWSPDNETSPINTLIHYWRFDERFCASPGKPRELPYEGPNGFVALAKCFAGDIPASAIRQELLREKIAKYTQAGLLALERDFSFPESLDEDFLRNAAFSLRNLALTLVHNASLVESGRSSEEDHQNLRRFERIAWSRRLAPEELKRFQLWVRDHGAEFIQEADRYISEREESSDVSAAEVHPVSGVGVFFFSDT
jgi:Family of unknown function (DUF6502)